MSNGGFDTGLWQSFLDYLYRTGEISVCSDFHGRCGEVAQMLDNDITGMVSTVVDYSVNSASETNFSIECADETLEKLLTLWLENVNININGIPTGLNELSKEYYKERWAGSSLCLLRVGKWEELAIGATKIYVPTVLWFVNGSSVYIQRKDEQNYKLGSDEYYLDESKQIKIPAENEDIVIQKPFSRWFTKYPSPYLIKKGVYKNWKAIEVLQNKADEVISKVLPYLFIIEKGTENLFLQKDVNYDDNELKTLVDNFKTAMEKYKQETSKTPTAGVPFDQKYQHLIPDLRNILSAELYTQGYRAILAGLGFVSVVQGIGDTRKEEVINPKPFIAEINAGVDGFKSILIDVIKLIINENKIDHRKLFSDKNGLQIVNTPLKINVQSMIDQIRSAYIYGTISIQTYQEVLGVNPEQELERVKKEWDDGLRDLYYPHLIQNREDIPDVMPTTKKQNEKQQEKEKQPEHMQEAAAELVVDLEMETMDMSIIKGFAPEVTENYIRFRQIDPNKFDKNSFRMITLSASKGIKAVVGRLKGEKTTTIQSYLFDKKKWTLDEAKKWINVNAATYIELIESSLTEKLEIAPYTLQNIPKAIKKLPKKLQELWIRVWNETYERYKDESRAHRTAWFVVNREKQKLSKANRLEKEIKEKQKKLLDKVLGESDETIQK